MQDANKKLNAQEECLVKLMRLGGKQGVIAKKLKVTRPFFNQWLQGKRNSPRLDRDFEKLYQAKTRRAKKHV